MLDEAKRRFINKKKGGGPMIDRAALKAIGPVYKLYQIYNYLLFQPKLGVPCFLHSSFTRLDSVMFSCIEPTAA